MPLLKWSPTIEAGHLFQALTIAGGIGMAGLTAYMTVVKLDSSTQIDIALMHQRIEQEDAAITAIKADQKQFHESLSATLDKLSGQLTDLRVLVAGRDGKH